MGITKMRYRDHTPRTVMVSAAKGAWLRPEQLICLRELNTIYRPQANIEFEHLESRELRLSDAFGKEINLNAPFNGVTTETWQLTRHRNPQARINIFFVREVQFEPVEGKVDDCDALAVIGGRDCLVEDSTDKLRETIAHECSHSFGVEHDRPIVAAERMLMYTFSIRTGRLIPRVHVQMMRTLARL